MVLLILVDNDIGKSLSPMEIAQEIISASENVKEWAGDAKVVVL